MRIRREALPAVPYPVVVLVGEGPDMNAVASPPVDAERYRVGVVVPFRRGCRNLEISRLVNVSLSGSPFTVITGSQEDGTN